MSQTLAYNTTAFFDELVQDHRTYDKVWANFWTQIEHKSEDLLITWFSLQNIVVWTSAFIHQYHCAKEEFLLFPELNKNPKLSEGGPMCSLYFDGVMQNNPIERVQKLTHDKTPLLPRTDLKVFFKAQSPLIVPLQDHMASQRLLGLLQVLLQQAPSNENLAKALGYARLHNDIERLHFLKEETCLFVFAPKLIPNETLVRLTEEGHKVRENASLQNLTEGLLK